MEEFDLGTEADFELGGEATLSLGEEPGAPTENSFLTLDNPTVPPPRPDIAESRAVKADLALGEQSPGREALTNGFVNGHEDLYRQQAAVARDLESRKTKLEIIRGLTEAKTKPLTTDEQDMVLNLSKDQAQNFKTVFEEDYGRAFVQQAIAAAPSEGPVPQAFAQDPDKAADEANVASHVIAKKEIVQKAMEDLASDYAEQSMAGAILDFGASLLPGYSWYLRQDAVKRAPTTSFLPGNNVEEQIAYLYTLKNDDFEREFKGALNDIKSKNLGEARDFASDVAAFSVSDTLMDNIFGVADLMDPATILAGGAKLAVKGAKTLRTDRSLQKAMRGVVEGAAPQKVDLGSGLAANGNVREAARVETQKLLTGVNGADPLGEGASLRKATPSLFNPSRWFNSADGLSREATDRLIAHAQTRAQAVIEAATKVGKVDRLPEEALQAAFREAETEIKQNYRGLNDSILNVSYNRPEANEANVGSVSMFLGKKDGTLFETDVIAAYHAQELYKIPGAKIGQQGNGFYIRVDKNVDETSDTVRNLVVSTDNENPVGFINLLLGRLRSPDDVIAPLQTANRKATVYGSQELHRAMKEVAEPIASLQNPLHRKERQNIETILRDNRDYVDEVTGRRGQFFNSLSEFNSAYRTRFNKAPTELETQAYFSYVQLTDTDYFIRNLGLYRDKARQGIEKVKYQFQVSNQDGTKQLATTSSFEAKRLDKLPPANSAEDAGILIHDHENDKGRFVRLRSMTDEQRAEIEKMTSEGYEILQVANPLEKPVASWAGTEETVNFVIGKGVDRKKLDWKQVEYRPGGHVEYAYDWWVKQPRIKRVKEKIDATNPETGLIEKVDGKTLRHIYEGDVTIHPFNSQAEARKYSERYETARQLLVKGDKGLDAYVQKNLGMTEKDFKLLFEPRTKVLDGKEIEVPPFLSRDDPVAFVKAGKNTSDDPIFNGKKLGETYENLENNIRSQWNLYNNIDKKFAGERDELIKTIKERPDGALEHVPAKNLDPFTTLNRSTANVMRNRFLTDYKISAVEQWIAQYGHLLDVDPAALKADPARYLHEPTWVSQASDKNLLASAKNAQSAILNLLGTNTKMGDAVESLKGRVVNDIYERLGQAQSDIIAEHNIYAAKDPLKTARAIAFHTKLGLYAWPQFMTQASTIAHGMALAPAHAIPGIASGTMMRWLALNGKPQTVEHFAKIAERFGMKREWFKESYDEMQRAGLFNVEGEHAWKNDMFDPKVVKHQGASILDWGTTFFREGERLGRLSSWNMAYREWRSANPDAVLTNAVRNQILNRMDTMMVNMSRASNAAWQNGVLSIPTQFFGYQIRMAEQMLGGRLTVAEKARVFGMYSFLYGVPTAVGGAVGVNVYDYIRETAKENGYNGENLATRALMEGTIDAMLKVIGAPDMNVSEKFGPGGINLRELWDKQGLELAMGASGSVLGDIAKSADPFWQKMVSVFNGDQKEFPLKGEDFVDAFRNVSSVNASVKMLYALNVGKYITKNEVALSDVTPGTAIFAAITGLQPQELVDTRVMQNSLKATKEGKDAAQKLVNTNVRRAFQQMVIGDRQGFEDYMRRARVFLEAGGFRPDEKGKAMQEALGGNTDLHTKVKMQFINNAPEGQFLDRLKQFSK